MKEYIEIVHAPPRLLNVLKKGGSKLKTIANRILELEKSVEVHYISGNLYKDIPNIPLNNPIRVGGLLYEVCVQVRINYLKRAGFTNVFPDRQISFSGEEHNLISKTFKKQGF